MENKWYVHFVAIDDRCHRVIDLKNSRVTNSYIWCGYSKFERPKICCGIVARRKILKFSFLVLRLLCNRLLTACVHVWCATHTVQIKEPKSLNIRVYVLGWHQNQSKMLHHTLNRLDQKILNCRIWEKSIELENVRNWCSVFCAPGYSARYVEFGQEFNQPNVYWYYNLFWTKWKKHGWEKEIIFFDIVSHIV